ncbi:MAG: glutamate synthase subunit beta [Lachnospiraceae bacterium]|nr:glutamate synthase subunit beta [Lachnospiraceae bacterium]
MGKTTGFMEYARMDNRTVPPEERIDSYREFHFPLGEGERRLQGGRCMDCGVPLCQSAMVLKGMVTGCPLHNLIPEWNHEIWCSHLGHALSRLLKSNNFPEFTGRVCPALCEKACILGSYDTPVTAHDNELFIIEHAFNEGYMKPRVPKVRSGKKVAVIGSGPSGLAAADQLNHRGHTVCVYEREDRIGGLLMYGIPNMKLDKSVIERRRNLMEAEGVSFFTGIDVGVDISADELMEKYDAVVLCCGAKEARTLPAADPGATEGVYFAVDYLKEATKAYLSGGAAGRNSSLSGSLGTERKASPMSARGRDVVVVGGGDTGNDCIATAIRQGCRSVTAIEMLPMPPKERLPNNPWPEWPKVLKTDYGHEEAIRLFGADPRIFSTTVKECITGKKGELKKVKTVKVAMENGRLKEIEGSEKELNCNMLLIAAGFTGCESYTADAFGLKRTKKGTIATVGGYRTDRQKVFVAGDMRRGQSLVVWAIAEGRAVASEVDSCLMGYTYQQGTIT